MRVTIAPSSLPKFLLDQDSDVTLLVVHATLA